MSALSPRNKTAMVGGMNAITVVWVYTVLIVVGGLMGFLKAKSKVSLIMSAACAVPLVLVALGKLPVLAAQAVAGFLMVLFTVRYASTKKIMPSGVMAVVSIVTLGLLLWLSPR